MQSLRGGSFAKEILALVEVHLNVESPYGASPPARRRGTPETATQLGRAAAAAAAAAASAPGVLVARRLPGIWAPAQSWSRPTKHHTE